MESTSVTSSPGQHALTRSHSMALPLTDIDLTVPLDDHTGTGQCPLSATNKRNGLVSSMLIAGHGKLREEDDDAVSCALADSGSKHSKLPIRRRKSLAELLGVVLYKSRAQLHEFFSRRERPKETSRDEKNKSPVSFHSPLDALMSQETGTDTECSGMDRKVKMNTSASASFVVSSGTTRQQKMVPREPVLMGFANGDLSHINNNVKRPCRVPTELFCVTRGVNQMERSASVPEPNAVYSRKLQDIKCRSSCKTDKNNIPASDADFKIALVKSKSDSRCQVSSSQRGNYFAKASTNNSRFVLKTPGSLLPRDSKVGTINDSSPSSMESSDCISSVVDWLCVGSVEAAYNEPLLCSLKVDAIIDITNMDAHLVPADKKTTCPCTCAKPHFCTKLKLAVDDIEWENIEQYFHDANTFISGWRKRGSRVLVVSYHGKSRGPAFVVQHLMHYYRVPFQRALAHVRSRWPQTRINPGFLKVLQRLEKRLEDQREGSKIPAPQFPDHVFGRPKTAWDGR